MIDYRDWSIPLGRRFRALKLWFVLRSYGVEGLARMIADHISWATELAELVNSAPDFEIAAASNLALFNFRYQPSDMIDEAEILPLASKFKDIFHSSGRLPQLDRKSISLAIHSAGRSGNGSHGTATSTTCPSLRTASNAC